uniref:Uncharacterized protein n=1 Tax=Cucumis melo TaxID=3656 RepID=A0A9I9EHP2_CUCME
MISQAFSSNRAVKISPNSSVASLQHHRGTTEKWIIPDAEYDVGVRNVGNKGFLDAVNTASGKHYFSMHQESVGNNSSGEG